MVGALVALREAEPDVAEMIATYRERRDFLIPRLNELPGVSCLPPAGAFYAFPRVAEAFREGRRGSVAWSEALLEEAGVAVVPGAAFGDDEHVRISFACSRETLDEGLGRMARFLGA
jgi:aspartate aminotransferase